MFPFQVCKILSRPFCLQSKIFFMNDQATKGLDEDESKALLSGSDKMGNGHVTSSGFIKREPECDHGRYTALSTCKCNQGSKLSQSSSSDIQNEMQEMRNSMQSMMSVIATNMIREQKYRAIKREWASVAMVIDRIFFLVYIIAITISLVLTFPKPPADYSTLPM